MIAIRIRHEQLRTITNPAPMRQRIDPATGEALQRFLTRTRVGQRYRTRGAILYGSRARGDHRADSDADVMVLLEGEHERFVATKLAMTDLGLRDPARNRPVHLGAAGVDQ